MIFHDTTLKAIAAARPTTPASLLELPGIGPVKAERYADAVIELVRTHSTRPAIASA